MTRKHYYPSSVVCLSCLFGVLLVSEAHAIPAFPGAEGAGANATGGRPIEKLNYVGGIDNPVLEKRGIVYHVTTLDPDPDGVIEGSLRYGLKTENFWYRTHPFRPLNLDDNDSYDVTPRIIVFDVGGTIDLTVGAMGETDIDISPLNFTIAGQTAPGGITIHGGEFNPGHRELWDEPGFYPGKTNNMVLRDFSIRTNDANEKDGLWLAATNSIGDHLSMSWYTDEGVTISDNARDVTVQHSIIGPGWNNPDGDGSQIEGMTPMADISVYNNLYIHNDARVPRVGEKTYTTGGPGVELDFRNNVIYNWNDNRAGYGGNEENSFSNFVNNYYIGGAGTSSTVILNVSGASSGQMHRIYQDGNLMDQNKNDSADGTDLGWSAFTGNEAQQSVPYAVPHGVTLTPDEALGAVIEHAGANWWDRNFLDERAIDQLQTYGDSSLSLSERGTVLNSIDPADVDAVVNAPTQTRPAGYDDDNDGMPGWWEEQHGLDPDDPDDWKEDYDADGYINVEEFINEIAEWPAPDNIVWTGGDARYAEIGNWSITRPSPDEADTTTNWQPSRFDEAQINSGTVDVDAVGQHAGTVRIGSNPGDNATLNITDGWLKVEDAGSLKSTGEVIIASDATATGALNLTGGRLRTEKLSMGAGTGTFSFTGGVLSADEVDFDLVNDGGTISPGESPGQTHVVGDLTINSGTLLIELASASIFDTILVDDVATLGGDLNVVLLEDYIPESTDEFEILTADMRMMTFDNAASTLNIGVGVFDVSYTTTSVLLSNFLAAAPGVVGDYNDDGVVDAADYSVWRDAQENGDSTLLNRDPSKIGQTVDEDDYMFWRDNFGMTSGGGSGQGSAPVPEPATLPLAAIALLMCLMNSGRISYFGTGRTR